MVKSQTRRPHVRKTKVNKKQQKLINYKICQEILQELVYDQFEIYISVQDPNTVIRMKPVIEVQYPKEQEAQEDQLLRHLDSELTKESTKTEAMSVSLDAR